MSNQILDLTKSGFIEASAGTGKTFTLAEIFVALLRGKKTFLSDKKADENAAGTTNDENDFLQIREILVVTFTEASTAELSTRLRKRIQEEITKIENNENRSASRKCELRNLKLAESEFDQAKISTIHGFCHGILKEFAIETGYSPETEISADAASIRERFVNRFLKSKEIFGENVPENLKNPKTLNALLRDLEFVPDFEFIGNKDEKKNAETQNFVEEIFAAWKKFRKNSNEIFYSEILTNLHEALENKSFGEHLTKKISKKFKFALVDEFQDTDPIQWEIFRKLFLDSGTPFFCVGDPKQAIYKFRGGDVDTYKKAKNYIEKKSPQNALVLENNWRSEQKLIGAFNEIFSADKKISSFPNEVQVPENGFLEYSKVRFPAEKNAEKSELEAGFFLRFFKDDKKAEIPKTLIEDVKNLVEKQNVSPGKIAILVHTNFLAKTYLKMLSDEKIPATTIATGSIFEADEVAIFEILMNAILYPKDHSKILKAAFSEFFGDEFKSAFENDPGERFQKKIDEFQSFISEQKKVWEKNGFAAAFGKINEKYKCFENILSAKTPNRKLTNIQQLIEFLNDRERRKKLSPKALLKEFLRTKNSPNENDETQSIRAETDEEAVKILTIHKSKGLEFEIVFLPDLCERKLEASKNTEFVRFTNEDEKSSVIFKKENGFNKFATRENAKTNAAEFYVAITRAKKICVVYHIDKSDSYAGRIFDSWSANRVPENSKITILEGEFPSIASEKISTKTAAGTPKISPEKRKEIFGNVQRKIENDHFGIFSFSRILGFENKNISDESFDENEATNPEAESLGNADKFYEKTKWFDLPSGTNFGTLVHKIFENLNFSTKENFDELIENEVSKMPNAETFPTEKLKKMISETLEIKVFGNERFSNISPENSLNEMEFFFSVPEEKNLYPKINYTFKNFGGIYEKTAEKHWKQRDKNSENNELKIEGFVQGFIDLIVRVGEKYFIVDWKTNRITENEKLSGTELESEIAEHAYALQWMIYAVALRRFLKKIFGENYSHEKHFGGILYVFVRWKAVFRDEEISEKMLDEFEKNVFGNNEIGA